MNRRTRSFQPGQALNPLESRMLLSVGAARPAALVSALTSSRPTPVSGTVSGRYLSTAEDNRPADGVLPIRLNGTGNVRGLGRVTMTGTLEFGGFRPAGAPDVTGTVTLSNARGSVTVRLAGNGGHGQIPGESFPLQASIVGGTGAYKNLRGLGTATAAFGPNSIRCVTTPCPIGGNVSLSLDLRPPVR